MKTALILCAVISLSAALPNNFYHQEYKYKTSSSSYRNNELQHKKDNEGYLTKDGDLEGQVQPIINSHNQHSEYVNPKLKSLNDYGGSYYNMGGLGSGRVSSYGQMEADANLGTGYGGLYNGLTTNQFGSSSKNLISDGLASSDHISGMHSGYAYQGSYGMTGGQSYGMNSNLQTVINQLENELASQLNGAVYRYGNNGYSTSTMQILEEELRRNLTDRLQDALMHQYGAQSIRGGYSYSINDGRTANVANYRHQELMDLQRQLENNLLNRLRSQYNQAYSSSSHHSSSSYSNSQYTSVRPMYDNYYSSSTMRPYYTSTIVYPTVTYPTGYTSSYTQSHSSSMQQSHTSSVRYTPIPNPDSITVIASRVQNDLSSRLNALLDNAESLYFSGRRDYNMDYYNECLERIQNEIRSNMTYLLDNELRRNYGNQALRDGYMYSLGPDGQYSAEYNYMLNDLENLKRQIENNLFNRLNTDFETYKQRYIVSSYGSNFVSSTNTGSYYPRYGSSTPSYYDVTTRPTSDHLLPLIASGGSGSYNYISGRSGSYSSTSSFSELQRQLQTDLSRQLQSAILRNQYRYSPQTYQTYYQELSDELQRNLTRQLQEAMTGHYGASYGSYSMQQMNELRNALQSDLMRQLQQGLQTYSSSSSSHYAASSSSSSSNSNYRPVRLAAATTHGGIYYNGENCDENTGPVHHRLYKRHTYSYSRPSYGPYSRRNDNHFDQSQMGQQQIEDDDLSQHQEHPYENLESAQGQQQFDDYYDDLTQHQERPSGNLMSAYGQQRIEDDDLSQHQEQPFENLMSHQGQQQIDDDLTQQPEKSFENLYQKSQIGDEATAHFAIHNTPKPIHQTFSTDELQSSHDSRNNHNNHFFSNANKLEKHDGNSQSRNALNDYKMAVDSHLNFMQQEMEADQRHYHQPQSHSQINSNRNKLESQSQTKPIESSELSVQPLSAQTINEEITSTTIKPGFWKRVGNSLRDGVNKIRDKISGPKNTENVTEQEIKPIDSMYKPSNKQLEIDQQLDNGDLTQQIEEEPFGKLEAGQQQIELQHTEDDAYGKLHAPKQVDDGLTQQMEQEPFDLDIGSRYKSTSQKPQRFDYVYQQPIASQTNDFVVSNQYRSTSEKPHRFVYFHPEPFSNQNQVELNQKQVEEQQIDDSDLTQQVQEPFGKLDIESEQSNQNLLTQQRKEPFGKLETVNEQKPIELGQQQVELEELGQQIEDSDLTQQIEQEPFQNSRRNNQQKDEKNTNLGLTNNIVNKSTTTNTQVTESTTPTYYSTNSNVQSLAEAEAEADRLLAILRQNRRESSSSYGYSSHSSHSNRYEGRGHYITRQSSFSSTTEPTIREINLDGINFGNGYRTLTSQNQLGESGINGRNSYGRHTGTYSHSQSYDQRPEDSDIESESSGGDSYNRRMGTYSTFQNRYNQRSEDSNDFQRRYSFRTDTENQNKPKHLTAQLHYGTPRHVIEEVEIAQEIQPVEEQHATLVHPSPASIETAPEPVNSYATNSGVKGHRKFVPPEVELTSTEVPENTTASNWWKRFGNKLRQ